MEKLKAAYGLIVWLSRQDWETRRALGTLFLLCVAMSALAYVFKDE